MCWNDWSGWQRIAEVHALPIIRNALYHVSKDAKRRAEVVRVGSDKLPKLKQIAAARNMNCEQLLNMIVDRLIEKWAPPERSPD